MEEADIAYHVLRKDVNNELFIEFLEEATRDKALDLLTTSDAFKEDETNEI